jgi:hypothetical protein
MFLKEIIFYHLTINVMQKMLTKFFSILLFVFFFTQSTIAGSLTGPQSVCKGSTVSYIYDDENAYCNNIEWAVYENGSLKTTGIQYFPGYINVTWGNSGSGQVRARGYSPKIETDSNGNVTVTGCWIVGSWNSLSISILSDEPSGILTPANCTDYVNRTYTVQSGCSGTYDWEAPLNWVIDNGTNTITKVGQTVVIKVPSSGLNTTAGLYTLKVRKSSINGSIAGPWYSAQVQLGPVSSSQVSIYKGSTPSTATLQLCPNTSYSLGALAPPGTTLTYWSFSGNFISSSGFGFSGNCTTGSGTVGGQITISGYNNCGSFTISKTVTMSYNCPFYLIASDVTLYPNPATSDQITVEWPEEASVNAITLLNREGNKVKTVEPGKKSATFNLEKLPHGEYYIHLYVGDEVIIKRFLKK